MGSEVSYKYKVNCQPQQHKWPWRGCVAAALRYPRGAWKKLIVAQQGTIKFPLGVWTFLFNCKRSLRLSRLRDCDTRATTLTSRGYHRR